ncbi:MAG: DUF2273 domain-containing protein [Coriobacteriia bacterium]|nr:DUF2273 domain-containing protein [Coriobacteriia bacterium]
MDKKAPEQDNKIELQEKKQSNAFVRWWTRRMQEFGVFYHRNTNAFWFSLLGFLIALSFLTIGVGRTLVFIIFIFLGVVFGQYLDGKPRIIAFFHRLIKRR